MVRPFSDHWNFEEGRLSSGIFKSSLSISVDRSASRPEAECISFLLNENPINSGVLKISKQFCMECDTVVTYSPIISAIEKENNPFHSLINGSGIIGTKGSHGKCLLKKSLVLISPQKM